MSETLYMAQGRTDSDPEVDASLFHTLDIIDERPDGFDWGKAYALPIFGLLKRPGVPVNPLHMSKQIKPLLKRVPRSMLKDPKKRMEMARRTAGRHEKIARFRVDLTTNDVIDKVA